VAPDNREQSIGDAVTEISERASLLVREEIELAKAEISEKLSRLIKGVIIGTAAGVFVIAALLLVLHGLSWLGAIELFDGDVYWGYFLVAGVLFVLGGLAGWIAAKAVRSSSPPKPEMAIEEAKKIRETVAAEAQADTAPAGQA
jgi:H+/Cl- antiporter ClcA